MFKSKKFWNYEASQSTDLKQEALDGYKQKGRVYEDLCYFYDHMGIGVHNSLKMPYGSENIEPSAFSFINTMVDINTLKILFTILPNVKVVTIKFSSNNIDVANSDYLFNSILTKPNNIYNLVYEWNNVIVINNKKYDLGQLTEEVLSDEKIMVEINKYEANLCKLATSHKLEALCLRGNMIGDRAAITLFENLKTNQNLRVLNLYKNNLTSDCISSLSAMLEFNKKLDELNIGQNFFNDEDFEVLKYYLGCFPMSHDQLDAHQKKIKDRDAIIEKNKKLKAQKKNEDPVPHLTEVTLIGETYYTVRNTTLKNLNMIKNSFTSNCFHSLIFILDYNQNLLVSIDGQIYTKEQKETLLDPMGRYLTRVYLTK